MKKKHYFIISAALMLIMSTISYAEHVSQAINELDEPGGGGGFFLKECWNTDQMEKTDRETDELRECFECDIWHFRVKKVESTKKCQIH